MLKNKISKNVTPLLGRIFSRIPFSPNAWTLTSLAFAVAGFVLIVNDMFLYSIILFSLSILLDSVDGSVARFLGKATPFGAYLDGVVDRFVEALILFGLMIYGIPDFILPGYIWISLLIFFGTTMTTFSSVYADHRKVMRTEDVKMMGGLLERAERTSLIIFSMVLWFFSKIYLTYGIILTTLLSIVTVFERIWKVRRSANLNKMQLKPQ